MKDLIKYLKNNKISFKSIDEEVVKINDKTYELIKPNEEGKIFDEEFCLTIDIDTNEDFYIFCFGGRYYYTPSGTEESPQLNELKYIGKSSSDIETKNFLGVHGAYEILNGSRTYNDWCKKAKFLGIETLGLVEKNTLAGAMKFQSECKANNIKSILGATYTVYRQQEDKRYDVKVYVKNKKGWENILLINKEVNVINQKYIKEDDFLKLTTGLYIVVDTKTLDFDDVFPLDLTIKNLYYSFDTVEFEDDERDEWHLNNLKKWFSSDFKALPISDAYYLDKEHSHIKETLNTISGKHEYISSNQYFKDKEDYFLEISSLFNEEDDRIYDFFETMLKNEAEIVNNCFFEIETGKKFLPKYKMTEEEKSKYENSEEMFWALIEESFVKKCPKGKEEEYLERLEYEVDVIKLVKGDNGSTGIDYFLILWDLMKWCKENGILRGHSRGSSAGASVAWYLDITQIDPIKWGLLFERFLNPARVGKIEKHDGKEISFKNKKITLLNEDYVFIKRNGVKIKEKVKNLKKGDFILDIDKD